MRSTSLRWGVLAAALAAPPALSETLIYHGTDLQRLGIYKSGALPANPGGFLFGFTGATGGLQYPDGLPGNTILFSPINVVDWSDGTNDASGRKVPGVEGVTAETVLGRLTYILPDAVQPATPHVRFFTDLLVPYTHIDVSTGRGGGLAGGNVGDIYWTPMGVLFTGMDSAPASFSAFMALYFSFPSGSYAAARPLNIGSNEYGATFYTNDCVTLNSLGGLFLNMQMHYTHILSGNHDFLLGGSAALTETITGGPVATYEHGDIFDLNIDALYPVTQALVGGPSFSVMDQLEGDRLNGGTVKNSGQFALAAGASIQYSLPPATLQLKYLRTIEARNMPAYNSFVVNAAVPF